MATNNAINLRATGVAYYNGSGTFSTPTITQFGVVVGDTSNNIATISVGTTGTVLVGNNSANPSFSANPSLTSLTLNTPLAVSSGGTGAASFTTHGVLIGQGTSAIAATSAGTAGQPLLSGGAGADPNWGTLGVTYGGTNINASAAANGTLLIGNGTGYTLATLTAGSGVAISNGSGSITISVTGGGLPWTDVTTPSVSMAVNNGYVADSASLVTLTLPSTGLTVGSIVRVAGKGSGGWTIAQNASQVIEFGSLATTAGVGGSLSSTNQYDSVELLYVGSNTFTVLSSQGNMTVV